MLTSFPSPGMSNQSTALQILQDVRTANGYPVVTYSQVKATKNRNDLPASLCIARLPRAYRQV